MNTLSYHFTSLCSAALLAVSAPSGLAAPGDLDSSFGSGGKVVTPLLGNDIGFGMAVQSDGKVVVAGESTTGADGRFAVVRYTSAGALDATFGTGGKVTTVAGSGSSGARAVVVQGDGKIVVAGSASNGSNNDFALVRYTAAGALDAGFGSGGIVITPISGSEDRGHTVAVQADGKIVMGGMAGGQYVLARYTTVGELDASFGTGGSVTAPFFTTVFAQSGIGMVVQSDGKIVLAGISHNGSYDFTLVRFTGAGALDASFGVGGIASTDFGGRSEIGTSVLLQNDGKLVIAGFSRSAGNTDDEIALARFTETGALDPTFGAGGKVSTPLGPATDRDISAALQSDGKILVAGDTSANFELRRYTGAGVLDGGFGIGGKVATLVGLSGEAYDVAVQSDGRIVVAGSAITNSVFLDFAVARYQGGNETIAPKVVLTGPTVATVTGPFNLSGTVNENVELASFTVTLNGAPLTLDAPLVFIPNTNLSWSVTGVAPENGTNTIVIEAVDAVGRVTRVTKTINYTNPALAVLAGTYNAVLAPAGTPDVDTTGLVTVTVTATGAFSGSATLSGVKVPFSGTLKNDGGARFKPALGTTFDLIDRVDFDSYLGALALSVTDPAGLSGTLSTQASGGTVLGNFAGKIAPYKSSNLVSGNVTAATYLNLPTSGRYTVAFPGKAQTPPLAASAYPQGDGYATLTLSNTGAVSLAGFLADGTKYSTAAKLRSDGSVPLFTQLYRKGGVLAGEVTFDPGLPNTDVSGVDFIWVRPALPRARYYRDGWTNGVRVDAIGAKHAAPASLDFGQNAADLVNGNAALVFTDGLLASTVTKPVSVNPGPLSAGQVKLIPATGATYTLSLSASTGVFSGVFTHTNTLKETYRGILLNKGANKGGFGHFLSTPSLSYGASGESGSVFLDPNGP